MIKILENISRQAGEILIGMQELSLLMKDRGGGNISLDADRRSQDCIHQLLTEHLPGVPIIAEEDEPTLPLPETFLCVDPLDGTLPYSRGCDEWGIAIAYIEHKTPMLGVAYVPSRDLMLSTTRGAGCFLNGKKLVYLPRNFTKRCFLGLDIHHATHPRFLTEVLSPLLVDVGLVRSQGSAVVSTIAFARGHTDAHINQLGGAIWDFANMALAANELDALCCSLSGQELVWDKIDMNILVSHNKFLAEKILSLVDRMTTQASS